MSRTVRAATQRDIDGSAAVLSQGFADDPLMSAIWPEPARRHEALHQFFSSSLRYTHLRHGGVQIAESANHIAGVAIWDPPGKVRDQSTFDFIRSIPAVVSCLRDRIPAALKVKDALQEHQPAEPHWYLANIATSQDQRGRGHADAMIIERLAAAGADAAYLVCTREDNISFYTRHGFDVVSEFVLPVAHRPTMWGMLRRPASAAVDRTANSRHDAHD